MFILEHFLGTAVNFAVVLVMGILGSLIKRGIPKRITDGIMAAVAICVIYIGIDGMLETAPPVGEDSFINAGLFKVLVMIISMALGTLLGELVDLDRAITKLGELAERKLGKLGRGGNFARGFVSCSLLFCVGAMAINGAIEDAAGNPEILLAKSVIDGITVFVMAGSLGIGCAASAFFLLIYQGSISLLSLAVLGAVGASTLTYMSVTGSLIIVFLGTNLLGITKVKTANMTPAIFISIGVEALLKLVF
ncbi:MAG: DUF554 domain-containing protein [Clostridia bacterium]|nr:DUF554 domain-containing protein [Clostridia bacterium]